MYGIGDVTREAEVSGVCRQSDGSCQRDCQLGEGDDLVGKAGNWKDQVCGHSGVKDVGDRREGSEGSNAERSGDGRGEVEVREADHGQ